MYLKVNTFGQQKSIAKKAILLLVKWAVCSSLFCTYSDNDSQTCPHFDRFGNSSNF